MQKSCQSTQLSKTFFKKPRKPGCRSFKNLEYTLLYLYSNSIVNMSKDMN